MMRQWYISIFVLCSLWGYGQQVPVLSTVGENNMVYNPAVSGSLPYVQVRLLQRTQWSGFEYAPNTQLLSAHSSIANSNSAIGGYLYNDRLGILGKSGARLDYAYHVPLGDYTMLSFGLAGKMQQYRTLHERIILDNQQDNLIDLTSRQTVWTPNADAGVYLFDEYFYLGFSGLNLLSKNFDLYQGATLLPALHLVGMGGINLPVGTGDVLSFSTKVVTVKGLPNWWEVNTLYDYQATFFLGAGYRHQDAIYGTIGANPFGGLYLYYSYDFGISVLRSVQSGSHEITLGYDIQYKDSYGRDKARYNLQRFSRGGFFKKKSKNPKPESRSESDHI